MTEVGIAVAFIAGIVSFASPCCLPLVPSYVGYMVATVPEGSSAGSRSFRRTAFLQSLAFVVGFSIVFVALWASVGLVGYLLRDYVGLLRQLGGAVLVFMGLHVAGIINISTLHREAKLPIGPKPGSRLERRPSYWRSGMLGVVFAAGWTPCIGPVLGGIIGLASSTSSVGRGTLLLVAYAVGLGIPFILVAVGATTVSRRLRWISVHNASVSFVTGLMLVAIGFLMITNTLARLSGVFTPLSL